MVVITVWQKAEQVLVGRWKPAERRKRAPMGGRLALAWPARWRAGHTYDGWVHAAVTRMAWSMAPEPTSS